MINIAITGVSSGYGGVSSVLINALRNFNKQEINATVILFEQSVWEEEIEYLGYSVVHITPFGVNRQKFYKEMEDLLKTNKFDYIWVNKSSKVNIDIFKLAKKYGIKTIAHSHGSYLECSSKLRYLAIKIIEFFTAPSFYKNVDIPIACSKTAAEYLFSKKYRAKRKVNILLNTINVDDFLYNDDERFAVRKEWGVKDGEKVLIAVGRLVGIKNPNFMLRLIEKLPSNYKLVMIGDGDLRTNIEQEVLSRGISEKVILMGSRGDVCRLLNGADVFILPSFHEGFPVSAIEAQANGLNCVISNSITDEVVVLDNCIKADINDLDEWMSKILGFSNLDLANRINCADKMKELGFDHKVYSQKFVEILKESM